MRQTLDDGTWFDAEMSQQWDERTRWDGNNHISLATSSQWEHESLFRTRKGQYVLHTWSQRQGSTPTWNRVTKDEAVRWLLRNGYDEDVPQKDLDELEV